MLAFHGKASVKKEYLARVKAHEAADEIIHGTYGQHGKGCAVGCTIHSSAHGNYETELGVPRILARLEDIIFEGMTNGDSKKFPLRFLSAIPVGADLSLVWPRFCVWLLVDKKDGVIRHTEKGSDQHKAVAKVAALYQRVVDGYDVARTEFEAARAVARSAAAAAYGAYAYAAYAAAAAAAAYAYAANDAAYAYAAAAAAAKQQAYKRQADKLIELLAEAPIPAAGGNGDRRYGEC